MVLPAGDKQQKEVWSSRLQKWLYERFGVYIEDFRFQPEESTVEAEEPLSAKRWVGEEAEEEKEEKGRRLWKNASTRLPKGIVCPAVVQRWGCTA